MEAVRSSKSADCTTNEHIITLWMGDIADHVVLRHAQLKTYYQSPNVQIERLEFLLLFEKSRTQISARTSIIRVVNIFPQTPPPQKKQIQVTTMNFGEIASFRIFSDSLFINHLFTGCYIILVMGIMVKQTIRYEGHKTTIKTVINTYAHSNKHKRDRWSHRIRFSDRNAFFPQQ